MNPGQNEMRMTQVTESDDLAGTGGGMPDVAPLAWVIDEIRSSLSQAVASAKGFLANKADVDGLRTASEHVHQVSGALQLLDLRGAALVSGAVEQLFTLWGSEPGRCLPGAVRSVEATLAAVRNYLDGVLTGLDSPPIRLFPYYRDILVLLRATRVHPADLIFPDLSRRPPFHQMEVRSLSADELRIRRVMYEDGLSRFLHDPDNVQARARMRDAIFELEGVPQRGLARSFWWVVRALFDALDSFQLPVDAELKRFLARLNQQLRRQIDGGSVVAERLLVDALYHVARADERIERVGQVRRLYGLDSLIPPDFDRATLSSVDVEAMAALRESLHQAKLLWSQLVASNPADPARFRSELGAAQTAALRLGAPAQARVLACIADVTARPAALASPVRELLGMEVATALLLLETGLQGFPQSDPQFEERADAMVGRIMRAAAGQDQPQAEAWIGELARGVQERSSMEAVVSEMSAMLREAELRLDRFFRNPEQRAELAELAPMFDQVGGVLGVLGHEEAMAALQKVRESVQRFTDPSVPAEPAEFARIAQNVGALGFFVSALNQQAARPRATFGFDPRSGVFSAELGIAPPAPGEEREELESAGAASAPPEAANVERSIVQCIATAVAAAERLEKDARDQDAIARLTPALVQLSGDAELTDDSSLRVRAAQATRLLAHFQKSGDPAAMAAMLALLRPVVTAVPAPTAPMPASASAADRELREVFVEEADEVLESVSQQLARLRRDPEDAATITMARRAFHTLKGSSRMVGLADFGEFAWAVEQCFNVWLAQERPANADLLNLAGASADRMRDWIEALRIDPDAHIDAGAFIHAAHVVRDGGGFSLPYTLRPGDIVDPYQPTIELTAAPPPDDDDLAPGGAAGPTQAYAKPDADPRAQTGAAQAPGAAGTEAGAGVAASDEYARQIGPLVISHGLYSVFLNESDECVRALAQDIGEWRYESVREVSETIMRRAHTLSGIADTVGLAPVCALADPLDALLHHLFERRGGRSAPLKPAQFDVLDRAIERMRGMLHQFAAGMYPDAAPAEAAALEALVTGLRAQAADAPSPIAPAALEAAPEWPAPAPIVPIAAPKSPSAAGAPAPSIAASMPQDEGAEADDGALVERRAGDRAKALAVRDEVDEQLLQVFAIEAQDLLPAISRNLRALAQDASQRDVARDAMRNLHTLKGSARMAGAMRLGEVVHDMETRIEAAMQLADVPAALIEELQGRFDQALALFEQLQLPADLPRSDPAVAGEAPSAPSNLAATLSAVSGARTAPAPPRAGAARGADGEPPDGAARRAGGDGARAPAPAAPFIRVRADVVDRLVDHAGEVSIARSKLESEVGTLRGSLSDLTENIQRLRSQLREVELQADAQIQARSDQVAKQSSNFDPLEFDRYSRLQELTRMLAESVEDVALVQSNMLKGLQLADNDLSAQSRLTRELQQQLMQVRLVPFANISERLYRVARQAAKELQKHARLDIVGAETEIDRSVLEQMAGPFEHLVRNAIVHGLELPAERIAAGKPDSGELRIEVRKEGNEIVVVFADDGAGLDLERVRERAISAGILAAERRIDERELVDLIFAPGLSTASEVTELAGRGVGMDVVREQVTSLGGRIAVSTDRGRGARFTLYLPMTLSIMQVVLAGVGPQRYALPAAMVEQVRRIRSRELSQSLQNGSITLGETGDVTLRSLAQLLGAETVINPGEQYSVALLRLGDDRLAVCADELSANQEVVVKSVGPQVARLAGVLGATVLGNGQVVLIINPVQMIGRAPEPPVLAALESPDPGGEGQVREQPPSAGLASGTTVMVVDDSLTVRRVTQRLLERNGYRCILAKDGVDAMRELQEHLPDVMLVDIEMPRMDGYDLTRNVRGASATRNIPIIMITSRTAEKHRRVAFELGVNEYLGKPYREEELLELIRRYVEAANTVRAAARTGDIARAGNS